MATFGRDLRQPPNQADSTGQSSRFPATPSPPVLQWTGKVITKGKNKASSIKRRTSGLTGCKTSLTEKS
ncbi:hypothetical protein WJX77_008445 [Trebouxia sp. C0004]